jgi:Tfp pilus assembly ATPase PilU
VTSKLITDNKLGELSDFASREGGMQRFDQHLLELYNQKILSGAEAMKHATNPEAVALGLRGIRQSGG